MSRPHATSVAILDVAKQVRALIDIENKDMNFHMPLDAPLERALTGLYDYAEEILLREALIARGELRDYSDAPE